MKSQSELLSTRRAPPPTITDFPREVGERLRLQRMAFEWRQADLAKQAGISVQTVKSAEKGESISYESILRLLLALGHGGDFLKMLEAPNFPSLQAHERYLALKSAPAQTLGGKRVRAKSTK